METVQRSPSPSVNRPQAWAFTLEIAAALHCHRPSRPSRSDSLPQKKGRPCDLPLRDNYLIL